MAAKGEKRDSVNHRTPSQRSAQWRDYGKKHRAKNRNRLKARREMIKAGAVKRHDGRDVHHRDGNTGNNSRSNLQVTSPAKNRAHSKKVAARGGRATRKGGRKA